MSLNNINLHILNASGSLDSFVEIIKKTFEETVELVIQKLDVSDVDIVVCDSPKMALPEYGIGGYTPTAHLIFIYLNLKFANLTNSIGPKFKRMLTHELHHSIRWRDPGYGETLFDALITEGLADHFDLEVNHGEPRPWDTILNEVQINELLKKAKEEFDSKEYNHNGWFWTGIEEQGIPSGAGYSLGFYIVKQYLDKHPDKTPSELVHIKSEEFRSII